MTKQNEIHNPVKQRMPNNSKISQAAILVGGYGKRLKNKTKKIPKPLLKFNDIAFLDYLIEYFRQNDFKEVLLLCSYKYEIFKKMLLVCLFINL